MKRELRFLSAQLDASLNEFKKLDLGSKPGDGLCSPCDVSESKVYYPSIYLRDSDEDYELPEKGTAVVEYKVTRKTVETRNGKTRHSATLDVISIEPQAAAKESKAKKGEVAKLLSAKVGRGAARPYHQFGYGERTRNGNGQFIANETGGADPTSMRQAYGGAPPAPQVVVNNAPPSRLKPGMVGAALGAGAMTKRGKRMVRGAGQMAMRGARAVMGV